jgi:hypothetical protein
VFATEPKPSQKPCGSTLYRDERTSVSIWQILLQKSGVAGHEQMLASS